MAGWLPLFAPSFTDVTGRINLGLNGATYFTGTFPYIEVQKSGGEINISNSAVPGVQYSSIVPEGATDAFGNQSPFGTGKYLDNNGDLLSSLPAGTITYTRLLFDLAGGGPVNYVGEAMTVDWTGGAAGWTVTISGSLGTYATGTGTTPLTFNWPTGSQQVRLTISGSGATPPKGVRVYKTALAADLAAAKVLEPGYRDQAIAGAKYLRFMDWLNTNWNQTVNSISDYPALANASWGPGGTGINAVNNNQAGVPLDVVTKAATETNKIPWITIPEGFANRNIRQIYSISRSSTPVVTTYGPHNFSNGDTVIFSDYSPFCGSLLTNPTSYASSAFTASGVNVLANDTPIVFGILANGSTDSSTYPTGITKGTIYWTVNATSTTYQIASSVGGAAITLTGSMTGTINVMENYNGGLVSGQWGQFRRVTSYASSTWTLANHGLADGTPVSFGITPTVPLNPGSDGSTYPTGINITYTYYVVNATANTFQTALSVGGAAMTLSGSMTGPINIWLRLARNKFTVANANQTAGTFEITGPGANTSGYYGKSQMISGVGAGTVFSPFDLNTMDALVAAYVNYIRARLPSNHVPIWEFGNELWNPQFSAFYNNGTQLPDSFTPDGVFGNSPTYAYMNGYLTAAIAHSVRKAYGAHSGYKFVFSANQTSSDQLGGTYGAVAGAQKYLTDHGGGLTITDLFDYLTVTSYVGSVSYVMNGSPVGVTFGTNTIAFSGNYGPNVPADVGFPVKLNTDSPGGTLPTGLTAGTLNNGTYPSGTGTIYWLVGSSPNFGLATTPGGSAITFSGGSGSNTATAAPEEVIQFLMAQSQSLHGSDPGTYPSDWTYVSDKIAEDMYDARWTGGETQYQFPKAFTVVWSLARYAYFKTNYTDPGKPLAGLPLAAYEGGESNVPVSGFSMLNDATWRVMYAFQQYSSGSATNFQQVNDLAVDTGILAIQSQFVDVSVLSINYNFGDFGAKQYIGDNNARWQGVVSVNALN